MSLAWRGAGLPRIERQPPLATGSGKILHLHVGPPQPRRAGARRSATPIPLRAAAATAPSPVSAGARAASPGPIVVRPLHSPRGLSANASRSRIGRGGSASPSGLRWAMLMGAQRVGGVLAGAFDAAQVLLGFVFGFQRRAGRPTRPLVLHARGGTGSRGTRPRTPPQGVPAPRPLLASGIEVAYWTYDPLLAANAHLNLNRLGARAIEYVPDLYEEDTQSDLHRDLGTDRFLVEWRLRDPRVETALARGLEAEDSGDRDGATVVADGRSQGAPSDARTVLVEISEEHLPGERTVVRGGRAVAPEHPPGISSLHGPRLHRAGFHRHSAQVGAPTCSPLRRPLPRGPSPGREHSSYARRRSTLKTGTGRRNPLRATSPSGSTSSSSAVSTRWATRICPGRASPQSRAARLVTVPSAA